MNRESLKRQARSWGRRQLYSLFSSLGTLLSHRIGTIMTVLVLGIAMVLPIGLYIGLTNLRSVDLNTDEWGSITVFLQAEVTEQQVADFTQIINNRSDAQAVAISPQQGMDEFRTASGFGPALDVLETNPLPWVLMVQPLAREKEDLAELVEQLSSWLSQQEWVETVQLDHKWLQRLSGLLALGNALVTILSVLFSLAVVVVIANTIRMDVANRADEIEILSLVGAGNGFIRQPFLYSGFWYGLLGSAMALLVQHICISYLQTPLEQLLDVYGNPYVILRLSLSQAMFVLLCGGLLGFFGALISVQRYLRVLRRDGLIGKI